MLAELDTLLAETVSRIHSADELLLTGDQIYADEVADGLLLLLTDVGEALLGWEETLPSVGLRTSPLESQASVFPLPG